MNCQVQRLFTVKGSFLSASGSSWQMIEKDPGYSSRKRRLRNNCARPSLCSQPHPPSQSSWPPCSSKPLYPVPSITRDQVGSLLPQLVSLRARKLPCPQYSLWYFWLPLLSSVGRPGINLHIFFWAFWVPDIFQPPSKEIVPRTEFLANGLKSTQS